jgi:hypothetical protein
VTCRLDYGNSLLYGLPDTLTAKFQRVQNACVRLVYYAPKHATSHYTTFAGSTVHWLPVKMRIMLILTYCPSHLKLLISWLHHIYRNLSHATMAFCYHFLGVNQRKWLVIDRSWLLRQHYGTAFQ